MIEQVQTALAASAQNPPCDPALADSLEHLRTTARKVAREERTRARRARMERSLNREQ